MWDRAANIGAPGPAILKSSKQTGWNPSCKAVVCSGEGAWNFTICEFLFGDPACPLCSGTPTCVGEALPSPLGTAHDTGLGTCPWWGLRVQFF